MEKTLRLPNGEQQAVLDQVQVRLVERAELCHRQIRGPGEGRRRRSDQGGPHGAAERRFDRRSHAHHRSIGD